MENPSKENQFRIWLKKNYGIQDYENYRNTQTEELAIQYAEYKAKEVNAAIGNLLAVMHGDGGHYREQHGLIKSIEDAQKLLHVKWKSIEAEGNV